MTGPDKHSPIGASSMYRWGPGGCPGSVRMSKGIHVPQSPYAEEGTAAHDAAARTLMGESVDSLTNEMSEAIGVYRQTIEADKAKAVGRSRTFVEQSFDLGGLHPGLYGTADCILWSENTTDDEGKILRVYDFKYGSGIPVEVEDNPQLKYYGLGAMYATKLPAEWVELVIIQPRCFHPRGFVRRQLLSWMDMLDFVDVLIVAAKATEDPNAPLVSGDHCRFCPASGVCPELKSKAQALAKLEFSENVDHYNPDQLAKALTWLPILESWVKNVRNFAYGEALHGRKPPGWKLVAKRGVRKWKDEFTVEKELKDLGDELWDRKLKSPAQMEKVTSKESIVHLWESVSSGYSLVPETDRREEVKLDAKSEFKEITSGEQQNLFD